MLLSLEGEEASGKSTCAYTAPLKLVGFAFDMGVERALYGAKFPELFKGLKINIVSYKEGSPVEAWADFDITVYELPPPIQIDSVLMRGCMGLWQYFVILASKAMRDPSVRSIVVDTMTSARRVKADAYLEALQKEALNPDGTRKLDSRGQPMHVRERLQQIEWGNPNDSIRDIYTTCTGVHKNLVTTHHLTDERKDVVGSDGKIIQGAITGKRILEGLTQTYRFVDAAVRLTPYSEEGRPHIRGTWRKCGYDLSIQDTTITDPTWDRLVSRIGMTLGGRIQFDRRAE